LAKILVVLAVLALLLFAPAAVAAADTGACARSYFVHLHLAPAGVTEEAVLIVYDAPPAADASVGDLEGKLLSSDGTVLLEYALWDPRVQFGEDIVADENGTVLSVRGVQVRESEADLVVTLPYSADAGVFELSDAQGRLLHTVDLSTAEDRATDACDVESPPIGAEVPAPSHTQSGIGIEGILLSGAALAGAVLLAKRE
jgi:hypothetical protein